MGNRGSRTTRRSSVAQGFPQSSLARLLRQRSGGSVRRIGKTQSLIRQRTVKRARVQPEDRLILSRLSRRWVRWAEALVVVQPATVIAWQQKRFVITGS